jgi:hypothetical protein
MTDTTNDPIAAAAANLHVDAAPSSTEPSLLERAEEKIHELEAEIKHLIHPEAASGPQSAVGEPVGAAEQQQPSDSSALAAESVQTNSAPASLEGEQGNVQPASTSSEATEHSIPASQESDPNAAASPAESQPASDSASSAPSASQSAGMPAPSASAAIRDHLQAIRNHLSLKGFETDTVAAIHGTLAEIEKLL